jgi:isopenicillin-N N-acyltransferase like protein
MKKTNCLILVLLIFALILAVPLWACTLWSAAGESVQGGGTLIVKNRDWEPNHTQELRLIQPKNGLAYLALIAIDADAPGTKAGINEKGLVAVSASASTIPRAERLKMPSTKSLLVKLLSNCGSVDEALARTDLFLGPQFLMLADRRKVAIVEIAPEGRYRIRVSENGALAHTNHYLEPELLDANRSNGVSSLTRLDRINALLKEAKSFSAADFIRFSNDRHDGPDNSIWRTGKTLRSTRTLAAWIVALPPAGDPQLYLKLSNPGQVEMIYRLNVTEVFQKKLFRQPPPQEIPE